MLEVGEELESGPGGGRGIAARGGRVRDLLQEVGLFDEEVRRVLVNGKRARLDTSLKRNDLVQVEG